MYNWSIDENKLKKSPQKYAIWRLEQMINFGLGKEKLNEQELRKNFAKLKIDPARKRFLEILLNE
jgi:hypothetical protein